ncbi:MAG: hypothetical protein Q9166_006797 [cf. Caloplaca sp. 2 TL-2023]
MDSNSASLYSRFTALKQKYNGLETWISVGGWSFTDPGPTQEAFSTMTSTSGNRQKFISSLLKFMNQYGFDGIDLDWEYPQADDRGGQEADTSNYVALAKELKAALGNKGLSMTLPTSFWYLQHFDVKSIEDSVDWFNFMTYDLHGTWDAQSRFLGPYLAPHTNLTEIDLGLDLLWRAGVQSNKVVLGLAWYGRSFTLADSSCNTPNGVCKFSGGANPGPCSGTSGILDDQEIQDIIAKNSLKPTWDHETAVKWITWDGDQWVSYDDTDTFQQKKDFANKRCLGGLMVWAIDQKDQTQSNGIGSNPDVSADQQSNAQQLSANQAASLSCYTTECNAKCKKGTNKVAEVFGQPGQVSTSIGKIETEPQVGETEIVTDTSVRDDKKSYCCAGFKPPPSKSQLKEEAANAAKDAAEAAAEQAALDVAAKAFCRIAVPALLAPLELAEDLIPIIGEILDIAEIAATPALIQGCVKGIEKEGKAEFKVFGKKHTISLDKSSKLPVTRPPKSSHDPEPTSSACNKRAPNCRRTTTITEPREPIRTEHPGIVRNCNGAAWPQACQHYSSVIDGEQPIVETGERGYNPLTCPTRSLNNYRRGARGEAIVVEWSDQHNDNCLRWHGYMQQAGANCERDEYPPIGFWQDQEIRDQRVRMVPQAQNGPAGAALFGLAFCRYDGQGNPPASTRNAASDRLVHGPGRDTEIWTAEVTTTLSTLSISFAAYPQQPDYGLTANPCWPSTLINDPGFALLTNDPWYLLNPQYAGNTHLYPNPPPLAYTQNNPPRPGYQKRAVLPYDEHNDTERRLQDSFQRVRAQEYIDEDFAEEPRTIKFPPIYRSPSKAPNIVDAMPTPAVLATSFPVTEPLKAGSGLQSALDAIPKPTGEVRKP